MSIYSITVYLCKQKQKAMFIQIEAFTEINTLLFNDACSVETPAPVAPLDAAAIDLQNFIVLAQAEIPKAVFPYKRKYETASQIYAVLASTSSRKEIASLYYVNADTIQADTELEKAFTNRKAMFYPQQKAVA